MTSRSVILIGGPDSGKTNYIGRLWPSFRKRKGILRAESLPDNIVYVDGAVEHLMQGSFAPRSDRNLEEGRQDFSIQVRNANGEGALTDLLVPDISGELWTKAVRSSELPSDWMQALKEAEGAILFVRAHSDQNVQPMDWVTARRLLKLYIEGETDVEDELASETAVEAVPGVPSETAADVEKSLKTDTEKEVPPTPDLPTQVVLCELLRYLGLLLADRTDGGAPRVSIVVAAWDLVDPVLRSAGPLAYLKREFPLFAGRLSDPNRLDIQVFGLSIVGGDLENDEAFKQTYFEKDIVDQGWVVLQDVDQGRQDFDITLPIAWAVGD